jgi:putative ABC transport system permease protein
MRKIPLAWLILSSEKLRFTAALAGIAFASMLMLMQLGFRDALLDSSVLVHTALQGDIVLLSPQYEYLASTKSFSQRRLYQALGLAGVKSVAPLYIGLASWKNPVTLGDHLILALGCDPRANVLNLPGVSAGLNTIMMPEYIIVDAMARPEFGPIRQLLEQHGIVVTEINGKRVKVGGLYELGTSFGANGSLITSEANFLRLFPQRKEGLIDLGLITLEPGANPAAVRSQLRTLLPQDVKILTRQEFIDEEKAYWLRNSPVGFIFNLGTFMGLIVGAVIVYQILYSDVSDHMKEYATLKAMGYADRRLFGVVLKESLILSVLGFVPGFIIARTLYDLTHRATFLPIVMTFERGTAVFILTLLMCCGAGAVAMRKLRTADPAEIF